MKYGDENTGCVVHGLEKVKHPTMDGYGIQVSFKCQGCHQIYSIIKYKPDAEIFLKSIADGEPNENIFCKKCNPIN